MGAWFMYNNALQNEGVLCDKLQKLLSISNLTDYTMSNKVVAYTIIAATWSAQWCSPLVVVVFLLFTLSIMSYNYWW